jgi:hypothetical protein
MKKILGAFLFTTYFLLASQLQGQTVFITKTGAKYHKESCGYSKTGWASDLAAYKKKGLTSCLMYKPFSSESGNTKPIALSSETKKVEPVKETKPTQTYGQCTASIKAESRCLRKSAAESSYFWQYVG